MKLFINKNFYWLKNITYIYNAPILKITGFVFVKVQFVIYNFKTLFKAISSDHKGKLHWSLIRNFFSQKTSFFRYPSQDFCEKILIYVNPANNYDTLQMLQTFARCRWHLPIIYLTYNIFFLIISLEKTKIFINLRILYYEKVVGYFALFECSGRQFCIKLSKVVGYFAFFRG